MIVESNNMPFAGKWTLMAASGLLITLEDTVTGELDLQAAQSPNDNQQFNVYGDPAVKMWLQAANWNYVWYWSSGYFAKKSDDAPAQFRLEPVSETEFRIVQKNPTRDFYLLADGSTLRPVLKTNSPPDPRTLFTRTVITIGLEELRRSGAAGLNLRGVDFSGDDLSRVVFAQSDVSYAVFRGSRLKSAGFQQCIAERTDFSETDLDEVDMSGIRGEGARFDGAMLGANSNLSGARIPKASFVKAVSTGTTPGSGPTMSSIEAAGANFNGADLTAATCNGSHFEDSQWNDAKLVNAQVAAARFDRASMDRIDWTGAVLESSVFDGAHLIGAEFAKADIADSSFRGANLGKAKLSQVDDLTGIQLQGAHLIGAILTGLDLTSVAFGDKTVLDDAQMEGVDLTSQVLDGVSFRHANLRKATFDKASMQGVDLSAAIMTWASATGVSLAGANLSSSSMAEIDLTGAQMGAMSSVGVLPLAVAESLDQGQMPAEIHALLDGNGRRTGAAARVTAREPGRDWVVEDESGEFHLHMRDDGVRVYRVGTTPAAILTNAYMPNANLADANLYAVNMSGAHWYGSRARAADAILENINLSRANLATMNFTRAEMRGANLSSAIVAGTNFTGATLTLAGLVRASFEFASMQGAIFTEAQLGDANLTNAAVSLELSLDEKRRFMGVPLFPLEATMADSLNQGTVTDELRARFTRMGYPLIATASVTVNSRGEQWTINNRSDPSTLQAGYSKFVLWKRDAEKIEAFGGSPVLVIRVGANNEQRQGMVAFGPTKDLSTAMSDETATPSGMKFGRQADGVPYEVLMTAATPPHPPQCIPTPDQWCSP